MSALSSSCIISLPFHNVKELSVSLFPKASLRILVQAVFISRGLAVVINVYTHFSHLLLLNIDELALLFPL